MLDNPQLIELEPIKNITNMLLDSENISSHHEKSSGVQHYMQIYFHSACCNKKKYAFMENQETRNKNETLTGLVRIKIDQVVRRKPLIIELVHQRQ